MTRQIHGATRRIWRRFCVGSSMGLWNWLFGIHYYESDFQNSLLLRKETPMPIADNVTLFKLLDALEGRFPRAAGEKLRLAVTKATEGGSSGWLTKSEAENLWQVVSYCRDDKIITKPRSVELHTSILRAMSAAPNSSVGRGPVVEKRVTFAPNVSGPPKIQAPGIRSPSIINGLPRFMRTRRQRALAAAGLGAGLGAGAYGLYKYASRSPRALASRRAAHHRRRRSR